MNEVSSRDDLIDGRDVSARIEELENLREAEANTSGSNGEYFGDDERSELSALQAFAADAGDDFLDGGTAIRESYFRDYAMEYAQDIGAISGEYQWPLNYIDWDEAADALKMDYSVANFDGVTYYIR